MDSLYIGNSKISNFNKEVVGNFVQIENETYYQIKNYDAMLPFFYQHCQNDFLGMYMSSTVVSRGKKNRTCLCFLINVVKIADLRNSGSKNYFSYQKSGKNICGAFFRTKKGVYILERSILKCTLKQNIFVEKNI
jgi:hypothetical protein